MPYIIVRMFNTEHELKTKKFYQSALLKEYEFVIKGFNEDDLEEYLTDKMNGDDDLVNHYVRHMATSFKEGCSYLAFLGEDESSVCVYTFTILKINKKSVRYSLFNYKLTQTAKYENGVITIQHLDRFMKKINYEVPRFRRRDMPNSYFNNNSNECGITPSMCFEFYDPNILNDLLISFKGEYHQHTYDNPLLNYIFYRSCEDGDKEFCEVSTLNLKFDNKQ